MTTAEMVSKIVELKDLQKMASELDTMIEGIKDELKSVLVSENVDEKVVDTYIIRYTKVITNRIDTGALRKKFPDVAAQFTKASTSRRFTVSG